MDVSDITSSPLPCFDPSSIGCTTEVSATYKYALHFHLISTPTKTPNAVSKLSNKNTEVTADNRVWSFFLKNIILWTDPIWKVISCNLVILQFMGWCLGENYPLDPIRFFFLFFLKNIFWICLKTGNDILQILCIKRS